MILQFIAALAVYVVGFGYFFRWVDGGKSPFNKGVAACCAVAWPVATLIAVGVFLADWAEAVSDRRTK